MSFGARATLQVQLLINGAPLECLPVVSCIPLGIAIEIGEEQSSVHPISSIGSVDGPSEELGRPMETVTH